MTDFLEKLRTWALVKLAGGRPVALNLKLHETLHLHESTENGLFVNLHSSSDRQYAIFIGPKTK